MLWYGGKEQTSQKMKADDWVVALRQEKEGE